MIIIILNEKKYAEDLLMEEFIIKKPYLKLYILAKYYYDRGLNKKEIRPLLKDFISKKYIYYNVNRGFWDDNIDKILKQATKYPLKIIDGIWITKSELEIIGSIHNKLLEKLAFTLLCLAKAGNAWKKTSNSWVNDDDKDIFKMARISCRAEIRDDKLNELYLSKLIELPKRIGNLSIRVPFVDDTSEKVLFVSDFRELGYEYLKYKGENIIRCQKCGILARKKSNSQRYCEYSGASSITCPVSGNHHSVL